MHNWTDEMFLGSNTTTVRFIVSESGCLKCIALDPFVADMIQTK